MLDEAVRRGEPDALAVLAGVSGGRMFSPVCVCNWRNRNGEWDRSERCRGGDNTYWKLVCMSFACRFRLGGPWLADDRRLKIPHLRGGDSFLGQRVSAAKIVCRLV